VPDGRSFRNGIRTLSRHRRDRRRLREWYEAYALKDMWRAFLSKLDHNGILDIDPVRLCHGNVEKMSMRFCNHLYVLVRKYNTRLPLN